jgi:hypothetical protein
MLSLSLSLSPSTTQVYLCFHSKHAVTDVHIIKMSRIIRCVLMPSDAAVGVREAACGPLPPAPLCLLRGLFRPRQEINSYSLIKNGLSNIGSNSLVSVVTGGRWVTACSAVDCEMSVLLTECCFGGAKSTYRLHMSLASCSGHSYLDRE